MYKFYKTKVLTLLLTCSFVSAFASRSASYDASLAKDSNAYEHNNSKNTDYVTTKKNFKQSKILGNCCLIAAMATLPSKPDLYNKVVLRDKTSHLVKTMNRRNACTTFTRAENFTELWFA